MGGPSSGKLRACVRGQAMGSMQRQAMGTPMLCTLALTQHAVTTGRRPQRCMGARSAWAEPGSCPSPALHQPARSIPSQGRL